MTNEQLKQMLMAMAGDNADQVEKIFTSLNDSDLDELMEFDAVEPLSAEELYDEIANCYFTLIEVLEINSFKKFEFPDAENSRRIAVDGKEYDLDCQIVCENDVASEVLCAIDCMVADLGEEDIGEVLKTVQKRVNERNG